MRFSETTFESTNENGVIDVCIDIPSNFEYDRLVSYRLEIVASGATAQCKSGWLNSRLLGLATYNIQLWLRVEGL